MSSPQPLPVPRQAALSLRRPTSVALYDDYADAQKAVDYLADRSFPVEALAIVGTDLRTVERVTGRLTTGRVLASGFLQGATWAGMFAIFMWFMVDGMDLLTAFLFGILSFGLVGMAMAWLGHRQRGGDRDFTSMSAVIATHYEVLAEADVADRARNLLSGGQAHPTVATTVRPGAPASPMPVPPPVGQDLSNLAPPFGQQAVSPSPVTPGSTATPDAVESAPTSEPSAPEVPEPDGSATAASQPYGRYWGDSDSGGIGTPPQGMGDRPRGFGDERRDQPDS